jgi:hypothetical protein
MRLARMTSRFGDLPDLYTFECRACGVSHIEPGFSASITGRRPRFRCGVEGPDEFDVMFESIMEEVFGDSEYKQWVKRLHDLGLIPRLADEWK